MTSGTVLKVKSDARPAWQRTAVSLTVLVFLGAAGAKADGCPTVRDEISTDRPDVTNSSIVVPTGSLQIENGINVSASQQGRALDGTNTRLRLSVAPCFEILLDLPTYNAGLRGQRASGFSDMAPALKWQISPVPGKIDLSAVMGIALPTGSESISGKGAQPYVQFPWSWELRDGWGLGGMFTEFIRPVEPAARDVTEITFVVERKLTDRASVFLEYAGDYPVGSGSSQVINSGGSYRLTPLQQIDLHVAFGLNRNSPTYAIGVGYSVRLDGLFSSKPN
jgi:Putative MetA-pathway of phenol degradation